MENDGTEAPKRGRPRKVIQATADSTFFDVFTAMSTDEQAAALRIMNELHRLACRHWEMKEKERAERTLTNATRD